MVDKVTSKSRVQYLVQKLHRRSAVAMTIQGAARFPGGAQMTMRPRFIMSRLTIALSTILFASVPVEARAQCSPDAFGANPFDTVSDRLAIQTCLDQGGTVLLTELPNGYGYYTDQTLWITLSSTVLRSSGPGKSRIIASNSLNGPILQANAVNGYEISEIEFNGNKFQRDLRNDCVGYRGYGSNLLLRGSNFTVHHVDSVRAMCGSGMEIDGSGFNVYSNWVSYNGRAQGDGVPNEPWSDGITLLRCDGGWVHDNTLDNNTDVDLVVGGGFNCRMQYNTIRHVPTAGIAVYGFAGIHVGYFQEGGGNNSGSFISNNTITSDLDKLSFGLIVGFHPWDTFVNTVHSGSVVDNVSSDSVVPLAVDGVLNGEIQRNAAYGRRGTRGYGCSKAEDYTAADSGATSIQSGWVFRYYHNGSCS